MMEQQRKDEQVRVVEEQQRQDRGTGKWDSQCKWDRLDEFMSKFQFEKMECRGLIPTH